MYTSMRSRHSGLLETSVSHLMIPQPSKQHTVGKSVFFVLLLPTSTLYCSCGCMLLGCCRGMCVSAVVVVWCIETRRQHGNDEP